MQPGGCQGWAVPSWQGWVGAPADSARGTDRQGGGARQVGEAAKCSAGSIERGGGAGGLSCQGTPCRHLLLAVWRSQARPAIGERGGPTRPQWHGARQQTQSVRRPVRSLGLLLLTALQCRFRRLVGLPPQPNPGRGHHPTHMPPRAMPVLHATSVPARPPARPLQLRHPYIPFTFESFLDQSDEM